jgi:hypothetical protein
MASLSVNDRVRSTSRRALAGWSLLFAFLSLLMIVYGTESALHFLGPAIDGPFQLYNSLRRIRVGQHAGVDFQFFHGLGIPYLHYPVFRALGGTFVASELARELLSAIVYPLVLVAFLKFFVRDWTRTIAWCAIVMMASIALRMTSLLVAMNSLLGIRSAIPTLLPVLLCLPLARWRRVGLVGVALGLALVFGTEQGLSALIALVLATALVAARSRARTAYLVDAAAAIAIGAVTLVVTLVSIGGVDGTRRALEYNFVLIPRDQYWYFGSPPNVFLGSWRSMPTVLATLPRIPLTVLGGVIAVVICGRRLVRVANGPEEREQFAFTVLALYGLISCAALLGGYAKSYVQPLARVLLLLVAIALDRLLARRDERLARPPLFWVPRSMAYVAAATTALMLAVVPSVLSLAASIPHWFVDHVVDHEAVYAGIWPQTLAQAQAILDAHRDASGRPPALWSTYAGLIEARNGLFQPDFDYIIHALGPANRAEYVAHFTRARPQLVQTVLPWYTQFEPWIEATSWDFYAELLQHYKVIGTTPWSFFWERQAASMPGPQLVWQSAVPRDASSITLPAPSGTNGIVLLQAEVTYRIRNPLRVLPLIGASPRYLVSIDGAAQAFPITLDPYATTSRFPILAFRGKSPRLSWSALSLVPGAGIELANVRLSFVPVADANTVWLENLYQRQIGNAPAQ